MKTQTRPQPTPTVETVGVRELKARISQLLRALESHPEGVVITRHGKPCAKLVAFRETKVTTGQRTLRGAFPHLPDLTYEDFQEAKKMWNVNFDDE